MTSTEPSLKQKLIAALEDADARVREERADRIVWMSGYNQRPGAILGTTEELGVLGEAEAAFREGHFISVILLAQCLIEQELADELIRRGLANYGVRLENALKLARERQLLPDDVISRIDQLRLLRNPFTHLKQPDHPHTLGNRFRTQKIHPGKLLEADAKEAFKLMYEVFRALIR